MMRAAQVHKQAWDLRSAVIGAATLDGFRFDVILDAIDRARDLGLAHIRMVERIQDQEMSGLEYEEED